MSNPQDIVTEILTIAQTALIEGKQLWAGPGAIAAAGRFENGLGDIVKKGSEWVEATEPAVAPAETEETPEAPAANE